MVTFGVNTGIVNQGYFAFYFMKDKETTTILHYNVLSYRRETIRLAMYLGDTFELEGGSSVQVCTDERQRLLDGISASCKESTIPDYDNVIQYFKDKFQV